MKIDIYKIYFYVFISSISMFFCGLSAYKYIISGEAFIGIASAFFLSAAICFQFVFLNCVNNIGKLNSDTNN